MVKVCMLIISTFLSIVIACSDGAKSSLSPSILLPDSKATITGEWRGILTDFDIVSPPPTNMPDHRYFDMDCYLKLTLFQYNLQLSYIEDSVSVEYVQAGDWKWDAAAPESIVFLNQKETFEIGITLRSSLRSQGWENGAPGQWQGRMEFEDEFKILRIVDLVKEQGIAEFPDSTEFVLTRTN